MEVLQGVLQALGSYAVNIFAPRSDWRLMMLQVVLVLLMLQVVLVVLMLQVAMVLPRL
jgi:hypothetical protein